MDAIGKTPFLAHGHISRLGGALSKALRTPPLALPLVLLLGLALRLWVVSHSPMAARDSIGFIRYALNLESPPAGKTVLGVIKSELHPPGYPAVLLLMSMPIRAATGETSCDTMVRAAQLTNVVAAVLLAIPMYLVGRRLLGPGVALLATALFQVLPVGVQITSDGLSDGLFLLTAATALWFGVRAFEKPSPGRFALAGAASGLAYLVRPEGLVLVAASGLVLLMGRRFADSGRGRYALRNGSALVAGALLFTAPYMAIIGRISNKTTANGMVDVLQGKDPGKILQSRPVETSSRGPLLAVWWNDGLNKGDSRYLWATTSLISEVLKTFNYVGLPLALIGVWLLRKRAVHNPGVTLLLLVVALHAAILWLMAAKIGYVSQRHTLLIVMAGSFFAAAAVPAVGRRLARLWRNAGPERAWSVGMGALLVVACVPAALKPLHANRAGHRAAGLWLAEHTKPGDQIVDPFRWAEFYAGRTLRSADAPDVHAGSVFVVAEPNSPSPHSRLPLLPQAQYFAERGDLVYHWPWEKPADQAKVAIYRAPPLPFPPPADFPR